MRADVQVVLFLPLLTAGVSAQARQPGDPHFKKGIGGGGDCGDLDEGGLSTVTWWYVCLSVCLCLYLCLCLCLCLRLRLRGRGSLSLTLIH